MTKRHQVFISSTYRDLEDERRRVMDALQNIDCIAVGMELFPAADEEQLSFIRSIIDQSDYYLLLIGGRYGSVNSEGLSYTEMEYDYAVKKGIYVIAFLHGEPGSIASAKTDKDPALLEKLDAFKKKISQKRLIKTWKDENELACMVITSLTLAIKSHPTRGWVRGSETSTESLLMQLNDLRQENDRLKLEIDSLKSGENTQIADLADGNDSKTVSGTQRFSNTYGSLPWTVTLTWDELIGAFGPRMLIPIYEGFIGDLIAKSVLERSGNKVGSSNHIDPAILDDIKIQYLALNYISVEFTPDESGEAKAMWHLTSLGKQVVFQMRAAKKLHSNHGS